MRRSTVFYVPKKGQWRRRCVERKYRVLMYFSFNRQRALKIKKQDFCSRRGVGSDPIGPVELLLLYRVRDGGRGVRAYIPCT